MYLFWGSISAKQLLKDTETKNLPVNFYPVCAVLEFTLLTILICSYSLLAAKHRCAPMQVTYQMTALTLKVSY